MPEVSPFWKPWLWSYWSPLRLNRLEGCNYWFEPNVGFIWERRERRLPFGKTLRQCIFECVLHPLFCVRNPGMLGSYGRVYGLVRATQVNHFVLRVGTGRHSVIWFTGCLFIISSMLPCFVKHHFSWQQCLFHAIFPSVELLSYILCILYSVPVGEIFKFCYVNPSWWILSLRYLLILGSTLPLCFMKRLTLWSWKKGSPAVFLVLYKNRSLVCDSPPYNKSLSNLTLLVKSCSSFTSSFFYVLVVLLHLCL